MPSGRCPWPGVRLCESKLRATGADRAHRQSQSLSLHQSSKSKQSFRWLCGWVEERLDCTRRVFLRSDLAPLLQGLKSERCRTRSCTVIFTECGVMPRQTNDTMDTWLTTLVNKPENHSWGFASVSHSSVWFMNVRRRRLLGDAVLNCSGIHSFMLHGDL